MLCVSAVTLTGLVVAEWNGVCFVFIFELRIEWREERWEQSGAPKTLRVSDGQGDYHS